MGKLDGKVAYITGAARGQGRSHAVLLAEEGADIVGVDICADMDTCNYPLGSWEDLEETARLVEKTGRQMVIHKADVRRREELRAALEAGLERFGRLDIVLANAGISNYQQAPYEKSEQAWQDTLDVCLTGVWNTLQVTVPTLVDAGRGGAVVITASTAGTRVSTTNFDGGFDGYTAAKTGLVGLMRSYAGRLGRHGIRVNTVHPTTTETPLGRDDRYIGWAMSETEIMATEFNHALPIMAVDPIDISNGVLYLVSDDGRYVTGQTLHVDAGNATVALGGVAGMGPGGVGVSINVDPPRVTAGPLDGQVAIVTGGTGDVGVGVCRALTGSGASVVALDLAVERADGVARAIRCDVTDPAACRDAVDEVARAFGGVDTLVNMAQDIVLGLPLLETDDEHMFRVLTSGPMATLRMMQLCHPLMRARGGGAMVNFASGAGTDGLPGHGAYAAAKEAIRGLTKVAAREWGSDNIRVNAICPLSTATPERMPPGVTDHIPLGRIGDPERDIGAVVAFLAGPAGGYITGRTLQVDGGAGAWR